MNKIITLKNDYKEVVCPFKKMIKTSESRIKIDKEMVSKCKSKRIFSIRGQTDAVIEMEVRAILADMHYQN